MVGTRLALKTLQNSSRKFKKKKRKEKKITSYCNSAKRYVLSKHLRILIYLPVKTAELRQFSWELNLRFQEV